MADDDLHLELAAWQALRDALRHTASAERLRLAAPVASAVYELEADRMLTRASALVDQLEAAS